ncbi:hypothetical protein NUU61_006730 [Penicillium alfredii]|uniref:Uncharacterized protein n=1 Tax=Penicillium alfredii TaxID=1506179 RepID=A0A9W9K3W7_9EURO|nr:uncharacterized protein NUU61_006730 [Penicillium alfredii]KAJ5091860.1 hypothetical protein NUU61_006730 [Penicillium alfredii]
MAPFRNFLGRKSQFNSGEAEGTDDNYLSPHRRPPSIASRRSHESEPPEYQMSVVNDSGVYLPPSPPERPSFWRGYSGSARSSNHRDLVNENEPFSISRESFDSYRRSFDISARSPVTHSDALPSRTSLDSRVSRIASSSAAQSNSVERFDSMKEEPFEDVGLHEEVKPKKKGIFARFGDSSGDAQQASGAKSSTSSFGFHIPGRRRGQSGGGSELGAMKAPTAAPEDGQ